MAQIPRAIIHIPHSSRHNPPEYREQFIVHDRALEREKRLLTDAYTDEIFDLDNDMAATIQFPVSRLLVDPERMIDDSREPMAAVGMGVIYARNSDGRPLRRELSRLERKKLIFKYYTPHHRAVAGATEKMLKYRGQALIIDCHSFPSSPLPCDRDQTTPRPDICIGTDPFHTPEWLIDSLVEDVESRGYSCKVNRAYAGAFVPEPWFGKNRKVYAIMLEINRGLYMDEGTVIAYQDWDSGGPGAGAGRVSVCEYDGEYYIIDDTGCSKPYQDMDKALRESSVTLSNEATREIVFLDRSDVTPGRGRGGH